MKTRAAMACVLVSTAVLAVAGSPVSASGAEGAIRFRHGLQSIDGLGFAMAFQRATLVRGDRGLSAESTREVLDLLRRAPVFVAPPETTGFAIATSNGTTRLAGKHL